MRAFVGRASGLVLALVASVGAAACTPSPTQLVVVVDTDLAIPSALDDVSITISSERGLMESEHQPLTSRALLPLTLGVITEGEFLGPIDVVAEGTRDGAQVVRRQARVMLVRGESLMLRLHLVASCVGVDCGRFESCGENGCEEIEISELPPWPGTPPALPRDAGADARAPMDAGPDAPGLDVGPIDARMPDDAAEIPDAFRACTGDGMCDDGITCTTERCEMGRCLYTPTDAMCADTETCTEDRCVVGVGCVHTPITGTCNDGSFCNGFDQCSGGVCTVHTGDPCAAPTVCDDAAGLCRGCVATSDCLPETLGPWGDCSFGDGCVETGSRARTRRTYACMDNSCVPTDAMVSESCERETDGASCGMGSCSGFGGCSFGDSCVETGTQSRTCTDLTCGSGVCRSVMRTDSMPCPRDTDGNMCGSPMCGGYGACDYSETCDESATQYRTCNDRACAGGSCGSVPRMESAPCLRDTDGVSCGAGLACAAGSCVSCAPTLSGAFGSSSNAITNVAAAGGGLTFTNNAPASGSISIPGASFSGSVNSGVCVWGAVGMGDRIRFYEWDGSTSHDILVSGVTVSGAVTPPCTDYPPYGCFYPCITRVAAAGSSLQLDYSGSVEGSLTFGCP